MNEPFDSTDQSVYLPCQILAIWVIHRPLAIKNIFLSLEDTYFSVSRWWCCMQSFLFLLRVVVALAAKQPQIILDSKQVFRVVDRFAMPWELNQSLRLSSLLFWWLSKNSCCVQKNDLAPTTPHLMSIFEPKERSGRAEGKTSYPSFIAHGSVTADWNLHSRMKKTRKEIPLHKSGVTVTADSKKAVESSSGSFQALIVPLDPDRNNGIIRIFWNNWNRDN